MPRKFDDAKKKEWLQLYEGGRSEKWIAHRSGCDARTVRKAITEMRLKRDVVVARIELVKDALRKHQESLLEELDRILSGLTTPQRDFAVLSWYHGENSIFNGPDDNKKLERNGADTMRRLLREHLKNDKLWRVLAQWEKANTSHLAARAELQRKTAFLLEEKTGYKLLGSNATPPFVCSYTTGPLLFKAATDVAFAPPGKRDLEKAITSLEAASSVNTDNGEVIFENRLILAIAPGREQRTKQNLLDAFKDLAQSLEIEAVVGTYRILEQITIKTRQIVEGVRLLGFVSGQCEICRRLGI